MKELTIPKPLSGPEIVEIICESVRESLTSNCMLSPHQAYGAFSLSGELKIHFNAPTSVIKETGAYPKGQAGEVDPDAENVEETVTVSQEEKAPNEARRDAGLGVPAIVPRPQGGVEERKIKYGRKHGKVSA